MRNASLDRVRQASKAYGVSDKPKKRPGSRSKAQVPVRNLFSDTRARSSVDDMALLEVVESYSRFYAMGSAHTARAKRTDLKIFLAFMQELTAARDVRRVRVGDWNQSATQRFIDARIRSGEAPASVARRLATIKHLGRTLADRVPGFTNPAREVRGPKIETARPKALTKAQTAALKKQAKAWVAEKPGFKTLRDQALVLTLLETGLRADELRLMRREQLDEKLEWFETVRTKGRRFRNVYIPSSLRPMLRDYLVSREVELKKFFSPLKLTTDHKLALFVSTYGASASKLESFAIGAKSLWRLVNRLSEEVSIHPHLLRHTFALELLDHSGDIRLVSQALGHGDVKVTMRYTERRSEEVARMLESMRSSPSGQKRRR